MPKFLLILLFVLVILPLFIALVPMLVNYIIEQKKKKSPNYVAKPKRKLIKTQIVGSDSTKSASSSIVRGAIGGALFGNLGMIGGALSGKNNNSTTFLLIYNDGTKETMTVKNDSMLYNTFIQLLEV